MTYQAGPWVEIEISAQDVVKANKALDKEGGIQLPTQPHLNNSGLYKAELSWTHWGPIQKVLDANKINYRYRDHAEPHPMWKEVVF